MTSTTISLPAELPVSDQAGTTAQELPQPQHHERRFDLDDAFSEHEDDAVAAFDSDLDSFLKELQLRPSLGVKDANELEDIQESAQTGRDSTSVSTLDIDGVIESHRIPPQPSPSSYSLNSEAQPRTPPDDSLESLAHIDSQFTNITLSPPLNSSTREIHDVEQHAYPNVIINVSKTPAAHVPTPSASQHTADSRVSPRSSTSEHAGDTTDSASAISSIYGKTSSMSTAPAMIPKYAHSPTTPALTASKAHRPSGPSVLQKVVSKTRPPHLPPKQKEEDEKHAKEWEVMMQRSRVAERKRREALEARRLARELSIEANTSLWQRTVLPDWKKAARDPSLRKLWWEGIPTKLRSTVWERAVGNGLALSKGALEDLTHYNTFGKTVADAYSSTLARARNSIATQRFPRKTLSQIERDISGTFPELHIFNHVTGPLYGDLRDLLCAWVISRADEGQSYVEGVARVGGMLLLNLTGPAQAFVVMRNLLETGCLRAFYGGPAARDDVEAYYRIFDTLLADGMPKVYFNFKQHQISPAAYLPDWLVPLFLDHLPLEACSRIWDVLLLEGDAFLFRTALATLACLESRLFFPERVELLAVLKGERSVASHFAHRAGMQNLPEDGVRVGPKYEIYDINEETLWLRIVEMEEWFKENTWRRLTQRELPDL